MKEKRANLHAVLRTVPGRQQVQDQYYCIPGKTVLGGGRASTERWEVKPGGLGNRAEANRIGKGWTRAKVSGRYSHW